MMTRREMAKAMAALAAGIPGMMGTALAKNESAASRTAGAKERSRVHVVLQHLLPGNAGAEEKEVSLVIVNYAPGEASMPHRHPGWVFGYILEGSIVSQVEPGPPITYHEGQAFYEPPMHIHRISRNASKTRPAKLLAIQETKKGQPLVLPVR